MWFHLEDCSALHTSERIIQHIVVSLWFMCISQYECFCANTLKNAQKLMRNWKSLYAHLRTNAMMKKLNVRFLWNIFLTLWWHHYFSMEVLYYSYIHFETIWKRSKAFSHKSFSKPRNKRHTCSYLRRYHFPLRSCPWEGLLNPSLRFKKLYHIDFLQSHGKQWKRSKRCKKENLCFNWMQHIQNGLEDGMQHTRFMD